MDRWWRDPTNPNIKGHYYTVQKPVQKPVQMQVHKPVQKPVQMQVQRVLEQMPLQQLKQIEKQIEKKPEKKPEQKPIRPFDIEAVYNYNTREHSKINKFLNDVIYEYPKQFMPKDIQDLYKSSQNIIIIKFEKLRKEILTNIFFRDRKLYNQCVKLEKQLLNLPFGMGGSSFHFALRDILKNKKIIKPQNANQQKELENFYKQVKQDYQMFLKEFIEKNSRTELGYLPVSTKMFGYRKIKKSKKRKSITI